MFEPPIDLNDYSARQPPPADAPVIHAGRCPGLRRVALFLPSRTGNLNYGHTQFQENTHYLNRDLHELFSIGLIGRVHDSGRRPWKIPILPPGEKTQSGSFFKFLDEESLWDETPGEIAAVTQ